MSKRGAAGYFHLEASLAGVATEVLRDHATGEYAQICIKSQRNKTVFGSGPGWEKMGIGPYADHSACVPSHVCEEGLAKCRRCPQPDGAAAGAVAAPAPVAAPGPASGMSSAHAEQARSAVLTLVAVLCCAGKRKAAGGGGGGKRARK